MSRIMRKHVFGVFDLRSDTNPAVLWATEVGLRLEITDIGGTIYVHVVKTIKGTNISCAVIAQLICIFALISICKKQVFSWHGSIISIDWQVEIDLLLPYKFCNNDQPGHSYSLIHYLPTCMD